MAVHSSSVVRSNNKGRGAPRPADNSSAHQRGRLTSVYDAQYTTVTYVPTHLITHTPPARLNITRLVFCRNYRPCEAGSCAMGDGCKFVHADVELESLESHPIHVKYSWRSEELCIYPRLPGGEVLRVTAPNNRPPVEEIASERVLLTRGVVERKTQPDVVLSHCAHYYFNRMCTRGPDCCFVHAVLVDESQDKDCERFVERCVVSAPRRDGSGPAMKRLAAAAPFPAMVTSDVGTRSGCDTGDAPSGRSSSAGELSSSPCESSCASLESHFVPVVYRHNPYGPRFTIRC